MFLDYKRISKLMKFHHAFSIGLFVLALTGLLMAGNSGALPPQDTIGTEKSASHPITTPVR